MLCLHTIFDGAASCAARNEGASMNLNLPAGQSVRQLAERLGVPVEQLQKHAGVADTEAPLVVDKIIEVPDGFLERRPQEAPHKDTDAGRVSGMNPWLALDIEQKRTRAAGGMKAHATTEAETTALLEARKAYLRFEADSNDLAIDLWEQLAQTRSIAVRAEAYAGQACAYALRFHLFGEPADRARSQGLSSAKAALMADPKRAEAHLGMALALRVEGNDDDVRDARQSLERAIELDPQNAYCWAAFAELLRDTGEASDAEQAIEVALEIDSDNVLALEIAGLMAFEAGYVEKGEELFEHAMASHAYYANVHIRLACELKKLGRHNEASELESDGMELVTSDNHRNHLSAWLAVSGAR